MTDEALRELARRVGVAVDWVDAEGQPRIVSPDTLRPILTALGLRCANTRDLAESHRRLAARDAGTPSFMTATSGQVLRIAGLGGGHRPKTQLILEDGTRRELETRTDGADQIHLRITAPWGYHRLELGSQHVMLAVAPRRCWTIANATGDAGIWGLAVQLYGLTRRGDGGIGDSRAAAALAQAAARHGADAIALSPTHAMFSADLGRYGPYSPSSRLFLNPLYADPAAVFGPDQPAASAQGCANAALIDWPRAAAAKFAILRRLFDHFRTHDLAHAASTPLAADFLGFCAEHGDLLRDHARFEVLHNHRLRGDAGQWSWRHWPAAWRDPRSATVARFAAEHADDVLFHMFAQWVTDRAFAATQAAARSAGMRVGLIADVAVGMDADGSHAWSRQNDLLVGLTVGAPPDFFNPRGQNWGLTAFSPQALATGGFAPFLATLRAAMRHAGGVRLDHAMSLTRLWLIPDGMEASQGAYVAYPLDDLLHLVALESLRHKAIVIGEDLGTVPPGFRERLDKAGIVGMRVLWFEHDGPEFRAPRDWPANSAALTTTHDLPTVTGWWRGADIRMRASLKILTPREAVSARRQRIADRRALWRSFKTAGVARGRQPAPTRTAPVVDAAIAFVARTRSDLALIPLEDALGLVDQPNLPGTIDEHPNWRRRLSQPVDRILEAPAIRRRLAPLRRRSR